MLIKNECTACCIEIEKNQFCYDKDENDDGGADDGKDDDEPTQKRSRSSFKIKFQPRRDSKSNGNTNEHYAVKL